MSKDLIIVESPAKVKTIKKFLGPAYTVQASVGHIRDLPTRTIGVDEAHDFAPRYEVIKGKEKVVSALREAAARAAVIYLAPDPDREGEAIAWHVAEVLRDINPRIKRIEFNEITSRAVKDALAHPRELNASLFDAQQARRILDRLVGYKISPLLWQKVKRGISAGRVQSVALRLIVEREEERHAFIPEEYWQFKAVLEGALPPPFRVDLWRVEGKKPRIPDADAAATLETAMRDKPFVVRSVEEKERGREPQPPFITSTLQQAANQRLGYTAKRTMNVAQRLYEGVELGEHGTTALITYMRTDSVRLSDEAVTAAAAFIAARFGKDHLAPGGKGRQFKGKGGAQDAHEAIRPVDVSLTPDDIKAHVTPEQHTLYRLIWSRFVASQMAPARFHDTIVMIDCGPAQWRARGERMLFPGFLAVMPRGKEDDADAVDMPHLKPGETLICRELSKEQKFTQPPVRYSEASLVRELEERGIGRPSTYATIISTLQDRDYVRLEEKNFAPTDLGRVVCEHLRAHFVRLMDVGFTAGMEQSLDKVAEGGTNWVNLLKDFSSDFEPVLAAATTAMNAIKAGMATDALCPQCGKPLVIKFGKAGQFLACAGYPDCRYTSDYSRDEKGGLRIIERNRPELEKAGVCSKCGKDLVIKKSRAGSRFIGCTGYPDCDYTASFSTGVACPRPGCTGALVEKSSKRGKIFYSCDTYPKCDYATWDWPVSKTCPQCGSSILVEKTTRTRGRHIACPERSCRYSRDCEDE
ncbi:MAG: type I DNA topoisomerase [Deltaproteobacteria bacterium]|jgi:DNA topoisomerase-1|nr:type I DNA topoisomerase [Deltaproteobacteria bacterium]